MFSPNWLVTANKYKQKVFCTNEVHSAASFSFYSQARDPEGTRANRSWLLDDCLGPWPLEIPSASLGRLYDICEFISLRTEASLAMMSHSTVVPILNCQVYYMNN